MAINFRRSTPADQLASGVTQGQNFRRGFVQNEELENEIGRQNQFRQLTGQILDPSLPAEQRFEAERQRAMADPVQANRLTVADVGKDKARDQAFLQSIVTGAAQINAIPSREGRLKAAYSRKEALNRQRFPQDETDELIGHLEAGDDVSAQALLDKGIELGLQSGLLGAGEKGTQFGGQQTFKDEKGNLYFGTTRRNPNTGAIGSVLAPIGDAPATPDGSVSLVSNVGLTAGEQVDQKVTIQEEVGDVKVEQEVDKQARIETNKLKAEFKLKPLVAAAVEEAVSAVKADAKINQENRSNARAMNLYNVAMSGLVSALGGTDTGPFIGLTPAVTANQQIADGAVAAMAPVLKQLFRAAGEGIFTDRDQALLLEMVPTRKDRQASRVSKLANIDAIVKAKLADPDQLPQTGADVPPKEKPADVPRETDEMDDVLIIDSEGFLIP